MTVTLGWRSDGPETAPPLVLLNSIGTDTRMWAPLVGPLAQHFRVIGIDARGHGGSPPASPGEPDSIADLGRDVLAVLDALELERIDLAGLSLGGMTAMWLAAHHPHRIGRLALLCTSAHLPPARFWSDRAVAVRGGGMAAIADGVVERWVTPAGAERDPGLVAGLRTMLLDVDAESYAQCCAAIAGLDLRADLSRIAAPTLVIGAADDPAIPPHPHAELIASTVPDTTYRVIAGAAHLATVEQPAAIARALLAHFGGGISAAGAVDGDAVRRAVLGDEHVDRAGAAATVFTAPFQDFITRYAWGEVWARPGLGRRDRSIATLAALIALGAEDEIAMHVRGALRNGLTADEIGEVLLHTALYAGLPRANRAFAIARDVLAEGDPS